MKTVQTIIAAIALCTSTFLPTVVIAQDIYRTEVARPRSTVDHTRTDRLHGSVRVPISDNPLFCPSGQVNSGGSCVLISDQVAGVPSWTSHFVGQQKCIGPLCFQILQDGRLQYISNGVPSGFHDVPFENDAVIHTIGICGSDEFGSGCSHLSVKPILINTNKSNFFGTRPEVTGWFVTIR